MIGTEPETASAAVTLNSKSKHGRTRLRTRCNSRHVAELQGRNHHQGSERGHWCRIRAPARQRAAAAGAGRARRRGSAHVAGECRDRGAQVVASAADVALHTAQGRIGLWLKLLTPRWVDNIARSKLAHAATSYDNKSIGANSS